MNIVLVVYDSLRKDCIGSYGSPPWWEVKTPHFDALAEESMVMTHMYPESLPTLPTRRALYTGKRVYPYFGADFHLKGDFAGAPGWGPIPEEDDTLAELLSDDGYRTGLICDVYHMFKPSKNFARGFNQWMFLRGQEHDPYRSGPLPTQAEIDYWLPKEMQKPKKVSTMRQFLMNMYGRSREEDYFNARVLMEASRWLEQNKDAEKFFLVVENFDPHHPWFVPEHYRRMYDDSDGPEQVMSGYSDTDDSRPELLRRTRANYTGLVTMCDRWFGHLYETMRALGMLENTLLILTTDHGHSIGDYGFTGKRGYPSAPEVYDVPLMIRHPEGIGAGNRSNTLIQHTDLGAQVLEFAGVEPKQPIDGRPFWKAAVADEGQVRDHVTTAWGPAITVIDHDWWLNCKIDGSGVLLRDLNAEKPFEGNAADDNPEVVRELFNKGVADAGGEFPSFIAKMAEKMPDAPGSRGLAMRQ